MEFPEWVKKGNRIIKCNHGRNYDTTIELTITDVLDTSFEAINKRGDRYSFYLLSSIDTIYISNATNTICKEYKRDLVTYHKDMKAYQDYCEHKKLTHLLEERIKTKGLSNIPLGGLRNINATIAVADAS